MSEIKTCEHYVLAVLADREREIEDLRNRLIKASEVVSKYNVITSWLKTHIEDNDLHTEMSTYGYRGQKVWLAGTYIYDGDIDGIEREMFNVMKALIKEVEDDRAREDTGNIEETVGE